MKFCSSACVVQAEYDGALHGSMQDAQQASTMSASLAKTNWINSGLRSQVLQKVQNAVFYVSVQIGIVPRCIEPLHLVA